MSTAPPAVGDQAPEFLLRNQHGQPVWLSELRGRNVAVVFYPYAFSGICTSELCELRDNLRVFEDASAELLAISCDPVYTLRAWSDVEKFGFSLLSDFWPHGAVASSYGVFDADRGCAARGTFVIDRDGVVRWSVVNAIPEARSLADYRKALAELA